jgi:monofunctional biosynthetic peptidoglycan transglycosylase
MLLSLALLLDPLHPSAYAADEAAAPVEEAPSAGSASDPELRKDDADAEEIMDTSMIMDFEEGAEPWQTINDVVMGGVSSSTFTVQEGVARFEGEVSLENNGGFASARSRPAEHDLSAYDGVLLRVRGDGNRYAFRLRTTKAFDGVSYEARFETVKDEWTTVRLPFDAFQAVFRGNRVPGAAPLDLTSIQTFGVLIADKQEGPFHLDIDGIKGYKADAEESA